MNKNIQVQRQVLCHWLEFKISQIKSEILQRSKASLKIHSIFNKLKLLKNKKDQTKIAQDVSEKLSKTLKRILSCLKAEMKNNLKNLS